MVRVILHVGMQKTATTTIQHTLEAQSQTLLENGVLYPKSGRTGATSLCHHALFLPAATSISAIPTPLPEPEDTFAGMQQRVEKERQETGATTLVLSSEFLWNPVAFDRDALTRIRDTFGASEFIVLAYLRPLEKIAPSHYAQRVTGPQFFTGSFQDHLSDMRDLGEYEYDKRLNDFEHVFGQDAVIPVWLPWLNRDVLQPFRAHLPELTEDEPVQDKNIRKSWLYVACRRKVNVLHKNQWCLLSRICLSLLARIDKLAKNSKRIEGAMYPMGSETRRDLEEKSTVLLDTISKRFHLGENVRKAS